jgi:hypothetical protein
LRPSDAATGPPRERTAGTRPDQRSGGSGRFPGRGSEWGDRRQISPRESGRRSRRSPRRGGRRSRAGATAEAARTEPRAGRRSPRVPLIGGYPATGKNVVRRPVGCPLAATGAAGRAPLTALIDRPRGVRCGPRRVLGETLGGRSPVPSPRRHATAAAPSSTAESRRRGEPDLGAVPALRPHRSPPVTKSSSTAKK